MPGGLLPPEAAEGLPLPVLRRADNSRDPRARAEVLPPWRGLPDGGVQGAVPEEPDRGPRVTDRFEPNPFRWASVDGDGNLVGWPDPIPRCPECGLLRRRSRPGRPGCECPTDPPDGAP